MAELGLNMAIRYKSLLKSWKLKEKKRVRTLRTEVCLMTLFSDLALIDEEELHAFLKEVTR